MTEDQFKRAEPIINKIYRITNYINNPNKDYSWFEDIYFEYPELKEKINQTVIDYLNTELECANKELMKI